MILRHIEREALEEIEDAGMSELLCLKDKISEIQRVNGNSDPEKHTTQTFKRVTLDPVAETTEQEKLKKEIETLQLVLQKLIVQKQEAANHTY